MVATLNQPQYAPWPLEEQVVAIFAGINGYLDDVPPGQVPRFQEELREFLRAEETVYAGIRDARDLPDEAQEAARAQIEKFKGSFSVHEEPGVAGAAA
jgi:F-type H+-transporting ATPase subunit alpha